MKQFHFYLLFVMFFAISTHLCGNELDINESPPRSPEGQKKLNKLKAAMIQTFMSKKIERRFLAANKLVQLNKDELDKNLLSAAIESLDCDNPNYKWFVCHYLQKISEKQHGINRQIWREWLRKDYKMKVRIVGKGAVSTKKSIVKKTTKKNKNEIKTLKTDITIMEKTQSVKALDTKEGEKASEITTSKIIKDKDKVNSSDHSKKFNVGYPEKKTTTQESTTIKTEDEISNYNPTKNTGP